ncbi:hypothetical protein N7449_003822 [Penicillium cf. viridicatum]|uniref:Uncharacterized protein n=1 Tax=Penicillium cf. viridicatum TaxID=2972119 RepID=A0A9W9MXP3_9EURO|nr:hypothetical protein N7449_003822 [Penicillium cf. viridicatum]
MRSETIRIAISTLQLLRTNCSIPVFLALRSIRTRISLLAVSRYFRLEDSEVSRLNRDSELPALTKIYSNERVAKEGFYSGPDVLHSLHCLNAIRKHLDMAYYVGSMTLPPEYRRIYIDHCIDHLRQALLCHSDLTPITIKPFTANTSLPYSVTFYLGQTEREYTCRSPEAIRNWVTTRGQRIGRIKPHHPRR